MQKAFKEKKKSLEAILLFDLQGLQEITEKQNKTHLALCNYTMQPSCHII